MKTAMKAAYEVVRNQVKDAAREKGVMKGVRIMFDRQRRQQEAQAREQALGAGVPGDDEEGGSQGSSQGHRLRGCSGAHRSLQEECATDEENRGDGEVLGDEGASTRTGKPNCLGSTGEGEAAGGWEATLRCTATVSRRASQLGEGIGEETEKGDRQRD